MVKHWDNREEPRQLGDKCGVKTGTRDNGKTSCGGIIQELLLEQSGTTMFAMGNYFVMSECTQ